jgi:hypothetical protein
MSAAWIAAGFAFFAGFALNEVLWRLVFSFRSSLIETQQELIAEQDKLIKMLRGDL